MELSFVQAGRAFQHLGADSRQRGNREQMAKRKLHQNDTIWHQIDKLRHQTVRELTAKYKEVFGLESRSNHRQFLVRRIAWRLQANAEGALSERARQRALALAEEAELRRLMSPKPTKRGLAGQNATQTPAG
jgi:Protein of unknown function (DUF2924)